VQVGYPFASKLFALYLRWHVGRRNSSCN
jgi:hypothetical protein